MESNAQKSPKSQDYLSIQLYSKLRTKFRLELGMLNRLVLATVATALSVAVSANEIKPEGYLKVCAEGESCALASPNLVAFGGSGMFVYKVQAGTFSCNVQAFGRDPAPNQPKTCSIPPARKVSKSAKGSSSSSSSGMPVVNSVTLPPGRYAIVSRRSGKALELDDKGQVVQNPYTNDPNQLWDVTPVAGGYFAIKSAKSGLALSVVDWQTKEGAKINLANWIDAHSQHWNMSSTGAGGFAINSRFNGKALDVVALNTDNKAPVRLWTYWGGDNQQWQFVKPVKNESN